MTERERMRGSIPRRKQMTADDYAELRAKRAEMLEKLPRPADPYQALYEQAVNERDRLEQMIEQLEMRVAALEGTDAAAPDNDSPEGAEAGDVERA